MNLTDIEQIIISAAREELLPRFTRVAHEFTGTLPPGVPEYRPSVHIKADGSFLIAGRGQLYLHGNQNLRDYAAGTLILAETGGYGCTLQGEAVMVPRLEKRSAVAALDRGLFTAWT